MLEPHQRAALIPNEPGVHWHQFLGERFIGPAPHIAKNMSFAIAVQAIEQQSQTIAVLRGLVELFAGSSLPVVAEFVAEVNLETREISIRQSHPDRRYLGQFSENGRVLVLRENDQPKPIHLVHEETLSELV
jgi:hypothetical protein